MLLSTSASGSLLCKLVGVLLAQDVKLSCLMIRMMTRRRSTMMMISTTTRSGVGMTKLWYMWWSLHKNDHGDRDDHWSVWLWWCHHDDQDDNDDHNDHDDCDDHDDHDQEDDDGLGDLHAANWLEPNPPLLLRMWPMFLLVTQTPECTNNHFALNIEHEHWTLNIEHWKWALNIPLFCSLETMIAMEIFPTLLGKIYIGW